MATKHQIGLASTAIDRLRTHSHWVDGDGNYAKPQWSGPTERGKAWVELSGEQIAVALDRYVPWDGFSAEEKQRVTQNVIADTSEHRMMKSEKWMEGIMPEKTDYERALDEASWNRPDPSPDRDGPDR